MFVDTSGWFCVFDEKDWRHTDAVAKYDSVAKVVTHSYIIAEFVALCESRKKDRKAGLRFIDYLLNDSIIEMIWVDERLNDAALTHLNSRLDKKWSLCDAASFVAMDEKRLVDALTTDHHFRQAGFIQLLES